MQSAGPPSYKGMYEDGIVVHKQSEIDAIKKLIKKHKGEIVR